MKKKKKAWVQRRTHCYKWNLSSITIWVQILVTCDLYVTTIHREWNWNHVCLILRLGPGWHGLSYHCVVVWLLSHIRSNNVSFHRLPDVYLSALLTVLPCKLVLIYLLPLHSVLSWYLISIRIGTAWVMKDSAAWSFFYESNSLIIPADPCQQLNTFIQTHGISLEVYSNAIISLQVFKSAVSRNGRNSKRMLTIRISGKRLHAFHWELSRAVP